MNRRDVLQMSVALGIGASLSEATLATAEAHASEIAAAAAMTQGQPGVQSDKAANPLRVPSDGTIPVLS